jgi:transposase-like protein
MRKFHSDRQILQILAAARASTKSIKEICDDHGITTLTFLRWWHKYQRWTRQENLALRALKMENRRLRRTIREMQRPTLN